MSFESIGQKRLFRIFDQTKNESKPTTRMPPIFFLALVGPPVVTNVPLVSGAVTEMGFMVVVSSEAIAKALLFVVLLDCCCNCGGALRFRRLILA